MLDPRKLAATMIKGIYTERGQKRRMRRKGYGGVNKTLLEVVGTIVSTEETILDIGAGFGQYVRAIREMGFSISGIDGTPNIHTLSKGLVRQQDLTRRCRRFYGSVDWGLFLEVGEHVPKQFESVLIDQVSRIPKKGLIVSWARVGQRGNGHINCQSPGYITAEFGKRGWVLDNSAMAVAKKFWSPRRIECRAVGRKLINRLLIFCRKKEPEKQNA